MTHALERKAAGPGHTNAEMLKRAHEVFPGASLGSFVIPDDLDLVVASARGCRMTDFDGREYIDYILGSGPMILGHAHPAVLAAVREQMERGTTYYALNEPSIELAEEIVRTTPGAEMAKFCSSGSEATFFALRLARAATRRNKVLKFEGGYHGSHDYALMSTAPAMPSMFPTPIPDTAGVPKALEQQVLIAPFNDHEAALSIIESNHHDLAAVILEPELRLIPPEDGFLKALRDVTAKHGIFLVFDEVVTGFRMTYGSSQKLYGVQPDLVAYGKIIGGGFPLASVAGPRSVMKLSDPRQRDKDYVYISGTLSGNPIAAVAGLATLRELRRPGMYEHLNAMGDRLRLGLAEIAARQGIPAHVLGTGPMGNIYFTAETIRNYRTVQAEDKDLKYRVRHALLSRGILTNLAQKMYISVAHSASDIDRTLEAFDDALRSASASNR
jgi:glutamate-1-semialdehyde 2,1-aminomutase